MRVLGLVYALLLTLGLNFLLRHTDFGLAIRALAQQKESAGLMGINAKRTNLFLFALYTGITAMTGVLIGVILSVSSKMGPENSILAFFGIGAYATALFMVKAHWPFALALPMGGVAGAVAALILGFPTLRLRGSYFAIATWAVARAVQQFALMAKITGGPDGLRTTPYLNPQFFYFVMAGVVGLTFFGLWFLLERAPFGLKLKAVREDQESAKALGLNPTHLKIKAFILSAIPAALVGGVFAYWVTFIDPNSALGDLLSDQALVMVVFGGMGTLVGPVLGAVIIFAFKTLFWAYLSAYEVLYLIILGAVIAASVVFLPNGVLGVSWPKGLRPTPKTPGQPAQAPTERQA